MKTVREWMNAELMCAVALAAALSSTSAPAADPAAQSGWPQFLGPHRNGISAETGLIDALPAQGPREVWRVAGGVGMSAVAVVDGRAVTLVQRQGKQWVVCYDAAKGETLWQSDLAPQYRNAQGDGPRATPTITGDAVYVFSGDGVLAALNLADGEIRWRVPVLNDLGGKPADYGMACSPLVAGDLVVVTTGAPGASTAAFQRADGKLAWKSGNDPAGYSSPALLNVGGREQIVAFNGAAAVGLDPATGAALWRYPYRTDYECNIATPLAVGGNVFISAGESHGSALLSLTPSGDGFAVKPKWQSQGTRSVLRNEWQTSILLDGHLYGFDNVGSAGPVTHLTCINAATGERAWQQPRFGKGNMIAADGKLFISTVKGELVLVEASPKAFRELGRAKVLGFTRQAPSLAAGKLYLRDDREVVCLDVRSK